jgi:fatty-acid peroxygenase
MRSIPRDEHFDVTLELLRDPYHFVAKRCRALKSDVFEARLMMQPTIFMSGPAAAALFYDTDRFMRRGAAPRRVRATLFGQGTIQNLDADPHRHRKQMFMALLNGPQVQRLAGLVEAEWERAAEGWHGATVPVLDALQEILMLAACTWAGVPLHERDAGKRARQVAALFDGAGAVGPRHWRSRMARKQVDNWLAGLVRDVRAGKVEAAPNSVLRHLATHKDATGRPMTPAVAGAEIANILRPNVAVAVYVTFIVHALQAHPDCAARVRDEEGYAELFVQEVRRWYPFFPSTVARVRKDFEWKGYFFDKGKRAVLDLYGTNHDPRSWAQPENFDPERFRDVAADPFSLVPQGGGDPHKGHRCPGEAITVAIMTMAARFLTRRLRYRLDHQDLAIDTSRLPALPRQRLAFIGVDVVPQRAAA